MTASTVLGEAMLGQTAQPARIFQASNFIMKARLFLNLHRSGVFRSENTPIGDVTFFLFSGSDNTFG